MCALAACGKKGPPLPPLVRVPVAADLSTPLRIGDEVYLEVTIPEQNIDESTPASVTRVEVYGATSLTPPPRARFLEIATRVATVPVAPAADPGNPNAPLPAPAPDAGALQGEAIVVRDALTADDMEPRELTLLDSERRRLEEEARRRAALPGAPAPLPPATALRRFYVAIPFSPRGVPGPPSAMVEMPLTVLPDRPLEVRASTTDTAVTLQWQPAGGIVGWLMDQALAVEAPPLPQIATAPDTAPAVPTSDLPAGPTAYNVYRQLAPDPLVLPEVASAPAFRVTMPQPVNAAPIAALTYSEPLEADGRERCYQVRAVRGSGAQRVESEPSARVCVTPVDIYPPAAPTGLTAVVGEGVINLIWELNPEADLGGYIVLRRGPAGDTLRLTDAPIPETRFTDRTVTPGVRYTYEVRAVDSRIPLPNVSEPAAVTETAR